MLDLIKTRRSIRNFTDKNIDDELVDKILEAGRWAPSGLNNQPWRFAVVKDQGLKDKLSLLTKYSHSISSANVLIAVFLDQNVSYERTKDCQAVGACVQNMLLSIHWLGLGGVWLGEILKSGPEVGEILEAPSGHELMAVIAMGYPAGPAPKIPGRQGLSELTFFRK
ncbi:MAG: nitroreductase family protein [Deltaproteobacteria bacterium]|nr:nitroreductase family protein [Deltaproteobacteria bacterium]